MLRDQTFSHFPHVPPPVGVRLTVLPPDACPYLPGRAATLRAFGCDAIDADVYRAFMDAGFRRSGTMVYQPVCAGCRECQPLRVPVATFQATRSQRRSVHRNADVSVEVATPTPSDEKFALYARYCAAWHAHREPETREGFERFLYGSPTRSIEFTYRLDGRVIASGICDVSTTSLSSVYLYFDPALASRSLGTFGAMAELDFARRAGLAHYYLGYWVRGCPAMAYKARFGPAEVLGMDGAWTEVRDEG